MHLALASFDSQLIKGEILQYCKGLTASIKNNHVLVEQSFHSVLVGDDDLKHHLATWILHLLEKNTSRRTLFNLTGKAPIRYC